MTIEPVFEAGVITVQTGTERDGDARSVLELVEEELNALGGTVREAVEVKPNLDLIAEQIALMADRLQLHCVLTVGGTGLHPWDVTPDATMQVIHRPAPGIAEALRAHVSRSHPEFVLSRGISGVRGFTLIINLPEARAELERCFEALRALLPAAVRQLGRLDRAVSYRQLRLL
ncbi:MAG TPA: molybdopterin-binding protein [Bacillota bacterium]